MDLPSSWGAGFALGLCLAAIVGLGALDRGQAVPWANCVMIVVASLGAVPSLEFGLRAAWAIFTAVGGAVLEWRDRTRATLETEPDEPTLETEPELPADWRLANSAALTQGWRVAAHRFVQAGAVHGFLVRTLAGAESPHKIIEWEDWGPMVKMLIAAGVLEKSGGTRWAPKWTYLRWLEERDELALPHPDKAAPVVKLLPVNTATTTTATTAHRRESESEPGPSRAVIEGEVRA